MCTYGGKNAKTVTDVFWKEGCKIPDIMVSEIVQLIQKGIISAKNEENRNMIFEATIQFSNVPKGNTIDDIKKFLKNFRNEMYAEKGKNQGEYYMHFYKKMRAKDACTFLQNTPNQFNNYTMISHKKEIGTNSDVVTAASNDSKKRRREEKFIDDEGFTVTKKK